MLTPPGVATAARRAFSGQERTATVPLPGGQDSRVPVIRLRYPATGHVELNRAGAGVGLVLPADAPDLRTSARAGCGPLLSSARLACHPDGAFVSASLASASGKKTQPPS